MEIELKTGICKPENKDRRYGTRLKAQGSSKGEKLKPVIRRPMLNFDQSGSGNR